MTTDLLDQAKPVRDNVIAAIKRTLEDDAPAEIRDGHQLGGHLASVLIAFTSERHAHMKGEISDPDLMRVLTIALADAVTHCAAGFRPIVGGRPIPASLNARHLLHEIAQGTLRACAQIEVGAQDFVIQFERGEGGEIKPQDFDVMNLLKGKA